jgi:hypothetical protein
MLHPTNFHAQISAESVAFVSVCSVLYLKLGNCPQETRHGLAFYHGIFLLFPEKKSKKRLFCFAEDHSIPKSAAGQDHAASSVIYIQDYTHSLVSFKVLMSLSSSEPSSG